MTKTGYCLCAENRGYTAALELRKVYRQVFDPTAATLNLLRIVDESGADSLYPQKFFVSIDVPPRGRRKFAVAAPRKPNRLPRSRR